MNFPSLRDLGVWATYGAAGLVVVLLFISLMQTAGGWTQDQLSSFLSLMGVVFLVLTAAIWIDMGVDWVRGYTDEPDALTADDVDAETGGRA